MRCYFMPIHASAFVCMKNVYTLVCIFVTLWAHQVAVMRSVYPAVREALYLVRADLSFIKGAYMLRQGTVTKASLPCLGQGYTLH